MKKILWALVGIVLIFIEVLIYKVAIGTWYGIILIAIINFFLLRFFINRKRK